MLVAAALALGLLLPSVSIAPALAASCPCSLWTGATIPGSVDSGDGAAAELGLQFSSDTGGYLYGVRYYKSVANTGTHVGSLWTTGGTLLAQVTFAGETAEGWQRATFAAPVPLTAGTTYVLSYHTTSGHYSFDAGYFSSPTDAAPLHVAATSATTPNGLFAYSAVPTFPTGSFNGTNYWVDPVFDTAPPAVTPTPAVTSTTPANGANAAGTRPTLTATFNVPVQPSSVSFTLSGPGGAVAGSSSYDIATQTATFTPAAAQAPGTTLTATVSGALDLYGHPMAAPFRWSFTLASPSCPCTLWPATTLPGTIDSGDTTAVELGTAFTADVSGQVTGVRFYKSDANTGAHVGSLWTATGTLLGQVTFSGESPNGWQEASFSPPVAVTAGTIYVVSYHSLTGHYSFDSGYFSTGYDAAPLHAVGGPGTSNGLFQYSPVPVFPVGSFNSANYWVAPVFTPARVLQAITVTPNPLTVPAGVTGQLTATGRYSDGTVQDLTSTVAWTSTAGATVSSTGLVTGGTIGTSTVTATVGIVSGSASVSVTAPLLRSIAVTPNPAPAIAGIPLPLTATGTYSDGSARNLTASVTWASSNTTRATVSAAGVVSGKAAGALTVTASTGGISATTAVTVRTVVQVRLTPTPAATGLGRPLQLTATAQLSDGTSANVTSAATWTSIPSLIATVSATGLVTPRLPGVVVVSASVAGSTALTTVLVLL